MSCPAPPDVSNGVVSSTNTTAEYSCLSGFQLSGNKIISCSATFAWGSPPSCVPMDTKDTIYAQFAPDWLLYLLGVLMSLLVLTCIACTIFHCCCRAATGAAIYPEGVGAASSASCCPCGSRGGKTASYERNNIHNSDSVSNKHDVTTKHTTTTLHGAEVNRVEEPNGVYTTHDGLTLVPVKPYELQEYQRYVSTKKTYPHHHHSSDTNGSTPRSEKDSNDRNVKTVVKTMPLWMPHAKPVRNNNTSTH